MVRPLVQGEKDPEALLNVEIRSNLNKLTPNNYERIRDDLLKIALENRNNMDKVLDLTLNNAWKQKKYAETYAELCSFLGGSKVLKFDTEENKTKKNVRKLYL